MPRHDGIRGVNAAFGLLLGEWVRMPSGKRVALAMAAADKYLVDSVEWVHDYQDVHRPAHVGDFVSKEIGRAVSELARDPGIAARIAGSPAALSIREDYIAAGLAALGTLLGGDGETARALRERFARLELPFWIP